MKITREVVYKFVGFCVVFGGLAFWYMTTHGTL